MNDCCAVLMGCICRLGGINAAKDLPTAYLCMVCVLVSVALTLQTAVASEEACVHVWRKQLFCKMYLLDTVLVVYVSHLVWLIHTGCDSRSCACMPHMLGMLCGQSLSVSYCVGALQHEAGDCTCGGL